MLKQCVGYNLLLEGVDYIQHIASPFPRVQPKDPNQLIGPAKIGVLNILQAAANQGVKRVVLTSSTGAIAYGRKKRGLFTEADWTDETNLKDTTPYFRSKTIAEKVAWEFIEQHQSDLELTVVNPALVLGPLLDSKDYGTSAGYILKMLDGSLPALAKIGYGMVDVRSITDLLAKAMLHPKAAGERFIGSTDYWTMREVAQVLREHFPQRKIPKASLPNFILRLFAMIDKEAAPVIIEIGAERKLSNEKAKKMLGWQPIANQQAIIDTAKSLIQHKFVS